MTTKQARIKRFRYKLNKFEQASDNAAFIGCQHPNDWAAIEKEYLKRKREVVQYFKEFVY